MLRLLVSLSAAIIFAGSAFSQNAAQLLAQCSAEYGAGRFSEAVSRCTEVLKASPGSVAALQIRAAANEKRAWYSAAIADYSTLIRLTNGSPVYLFFRAELHRKTIAHQKAIADYTDLVTREPNGSLAAKAFFGRGLSNDQIGRKDQAQDDYRRAVGLDPQLSEARAKIVYPFGDMTITEAADNIIPGIPPSATPSTRASQPKVVPMPAPATRNRPVTPLPLTVAKTPPAKKLLPERQPTKPEDERFEQVVTWRERRVKPTPDDIVWASAYIFQQVNYWKNRDTGDAQTAEAIGRLYSEHSRVRLALSDFKGAVADLTTCLQYAPGNLYCMVYRVYANLNARNDAAALAEANRIVELEPKWPFGFMARAKVHCLMGNKLLAAADEKRSLSFGGAVAEPCK